MSYVIEMLWQCSLCQRRGNRGLKDRYCCNCGHKKDDTDLEYMPDDTSESSALKGDAELRGRAGRDWVCKYCDSVQNQLNKCCGNCGATDRGTKLQSTEPERASTEAPVASDTQDEAPPRRSWFAPAMVVIACSFAAWLGWFLFTPRIVSTHVSQLSWSHDTIIDRYQVYGREGWIPESGSFEVLPLGLRHHHYERVHVGSHRESYREEYACGENCTTSPRYKTCSSNGNGTATCSWHGGNRTCSTKYCTRTAWRTVQDYENVSRKQIWYAWKVWDWGYNRTVSRSGHADEPTWPREEELHPAATLPDGEKERTSRRAAYKVVFKEDGDEDTFSIEPKSLEEFRMYRKGSSFRLEVTRVGSVKVLP